MGALRLHGCIISWVWDIVGVVGCGKGVGGGDNVCCVGGCM